MNRFQLGVALGLAVGLPSLVRAQCTPGGPPNPRPGPRSITGIVMDTAHDPLEGAAISIARPQRLARTNAIGQFRIDSLSPGTYELTVRRIGHEIAVQSYTVTDSGASARFCLIPDPRGLAPIITSVKRGGLSGFVGDSTYKMVAGAEVRAIASGAHALTDSAGAFFLDLKPGSYPITVKKEGFGIQLLSVTVPKDSGRQIAVWLSSPPRNARRVAAAIEDSMKFRMEFKARAAHFKLLSSEDLMKSPTDILTTVQSKVVTTVSPECEAIVDGGPYKVPLYTIDKAEIAAMEVYVHRESSRGPTSMGSGGTGGSSSASSQCKVDVYVWLKP
jgi:hypothetical protein